MPTDKYAFDWNDLAFGSKKPLNSLRATFIAAPRELSPRRFTQLVKEYLPKGNIVLGLAKEGYVLGFEDQPQFRMLQAKTVQPVIDKVNAASATHRIYTLSYFQRDLRYVLDKLDFRQIVLVNGSWKYLFHTQAPYYVMATRKIPCVHVSPFTDEPEAQAYAGTIQPPDLPIGGTFTDAGMLEVADQAAKQSFDNGFQTGLALGRKQNSKYKLTATAFNRVLPYQTYAWHFGASRERTFAPMQDLNHYDTNHAEVELIAQAARGQIGLQGTALFINLLPCPTCARMFMATDVAEVIYREDHSDGYAVKMLEAAGKTVRRLVP